MKFCEAAGAAADRVAGAPGTQGIVGACAAEEARSAVAVRSRTTVARLSHDVSMAVADMSYDW